MDFTVIARAGCTQAEFGGLVGVSRVTVNGWVRGRIAPHRFITAAVAEILVCLKSAIKHGHLPLKPGEPHRAREIRGAIEAAASRAKAAG